MRKFPYKIIYGDNTRRFLLILFILFNIYFQCIYFFTNGLFDRQGALNFFDVGLVQDSFVHLSLINEMQYRFPPTNFAVSGEPLKNYHYLYDALLAFFVKTTGISVLNWYFRIAPLFLSLSLSLLIYVTTFRLTKNKWTATLAIFFTVMGTSLGSIMPFVKWLFKGNNVTGGSNVFMTDQISTMIINPQGVLSIIIFLALFLILDSYERSKKKVLLLFWFVLLSISFGVKAYGGIVFALSSFLISLYFLYKKKDIWLFLSTVTGLVFMSVWIYITIDGKVAGLTLAPLWLIDQMVSNIDRLNEPKWMLLKENFFYHGNLSKIFILYLIGVIIYIVGSLGFRVLGLISIFRLIKSEKISYSQIFLLLSGISAFCLPLLTNQTNKAYEVVQFTPYFTVMMGIMGTIFISNLTDTFRFPWMKAGFVCLIIFLTLILNEREFYVRSRINTDTIVFTKPLILASDYIRNQTDPSAIFLMPLTEFNLKYLWFSGLTGRRTVLSGKIFAEQIGIDVKAKKEQVEQEFMGNNNLAYNYVLFYKKSGGDFDTIRGKLSLSNFFENEEVLVLKRN